MEALGITQSQLIEIGLNALGYLAAAGLSLFLYASYLNRKVRRSTVGGSTAVAKAPLVESERPVVRERTGAERSDDSFIRLNAAAADAVDATAQGSPAVLQADEERSERYARNRGEVIRLARKMIEAGNSAERVVDLLPISESEMRLVQLGAGSE